MAREASARIPVKKKEDAVEYSIIENIFALSKTLLSTHK